MNRFKERNKDYELSTVTQVRAAFWREHPEFKEDKRKTQNDYEADIRISFVVWLDRQSKAGRVPRKVANRATL